MAGHDVPGEDLPLAERVDATHRRRSSHTDLHVETLLEDSRLFADRARRACADVRVDLFPGQQRTFQMAVGRSRDAAEAMRRLADWARSTRWHAPACPPERSGSRESSLPGG